MAKHSDETKRRIYELWKSGKFNEAQLGRYLKGLVDKTTVQEWVKKFRELDKG